jgi:hypothetical protein
MIKIGKNDPCPCGRAVKAKRCCLQLNGHLKKRPGIITPLGRELAILIRNALRVVIAIVAIRLLASIPSRRQYFGKLKRIGLLKSRGFDGRHPNGGISFPSPV